jgi:hypothetical protein
MGVQSVSVLDLQATHRVLSQAKAPEDVFGTIADLAALTKEWHRIAAAVHPDRHGGASLLATECLSMLNVWKTQAEKKIAAGTYGNGAPHVEPAARFPSIVETKTRRYVVGDLLAAGDIAALYACSFDGGDPSVFKIARSSADNDLLETEAKALDKLKGDGDYHRFIPKLLDSFTMRGKGPGKPRRVNVIRQAEGYVTLAEVKQKYPGGLDFRDMAWMFKRLLMVLGFVHRQSLVHGSVLPAHVVVHPTRHGAKLIDWCHSVQVGKPIRAISSDKSIAYPPEVRAKKPATAQTDIFMAASLMRGLLGTNGSCPQHVRAFLSGSMLAKQSARPDDAWALHEEFDELLRKLVGKPVYRPLSM